jgi:hypothetical protein
MTADRKYFLTISSTGAMTMRGTVFIGSIPRWWQIARWWRLVRSIRNVMET